ncbi:coenzyme Q-binding protein COQ10 [Caulobacter ginsengisoli]|uniref:Coenzyme Q-binding protein COQ10 n=1 Tax=Caulobacter ginsengisoli TaxID=400775 RepID=A0ABU0IM24_9CAUL|nr:SRPBCC family protein [Caulobacter ginsengisoli]MDQ0463071.1 coenzyme Q-binding protein COQ10 [Caulobacter ginsengisoli]
MRHELTRILPYRPEQLFELVGDVEQYPKFVPWISALRVWNRRETAPGITSLDAEASVGFSFLRERFSTRVVRDANTRTITVSLLSGPFRKLHNRWRFEEHPTGTAVHFEIDFEFKIRMLDRLLDANFDHAVNRLIGCFDERARALYGP